MLRLVSEKVTDSYYKMSNMNAPSESYQINRDLTFYEPTGNLLAVQVLCLTVTRQEKAWQRCCLSVKVNYDLYEYIANSELFNLKKDVKVAINSENFLSEFEVIVELGLQPSLLKELSLNSQPESAFNYLESLGVPADISQALNCTENWYCLSVKQEQGAEEVGYRTLWDYISLSAIAQGLSVGSQFFESLSNFIEDSSNSLVKELESEKDTDKQASQLSLIKFLQSLTEEDEVAQSQPICQVVKDFFAEDDWNFVQVESSEILQVVFQGDNGRWNCYAYANEEAEQLVFYSVCPVEAQLTQLLPMAEFLSKANYGLQIGNFELDFEDGEIRYKTSIDVEGDRLTTALVKNLVYVNVTVMDKYLPGIVAIANNELTPDEAIARIE